MCSTCGCASGEIYIEGDAHSHSDEHQHQYDPLLQGGQSTTIIHHHHYYHHGDVHHHYHYKFENEIETDSHTLEQCKQKHCEHNHEHSHEHSHEHNKSLEKNINRKRLLEIEQDVLSKNNHIAEHNREHFTSQNILALNLVSSPGSGKTTLLVETLNQLKIRIPCAVIEGDQQTVNDAERIRATGVPAIQVNTGKGCHLDAQMVHEAAHRLELKDNSLLFIENVGNLVCPASFDLGEKYKIAVLSVTEGEDKPLKYPHMFAAAKVMVLNKIDLLPYVTFNTEVCINNVQKINPNIHVIQLSATTGAGMSEWLSWIESQVKI